MRGKELEILGYTNLRVPFDVIADGYRTMVEHAVEGRITIDLDRVRLDAAGEAWATQSSGADSKLVICPAE